MTRRDGRLGSAVFPALVALIIHPDEGAILFDTGYDPAFFEATRTWPEILYRWMTPVDLPPGETIVEQLPRFGVAPDDVRAVVISHFHGDHVAGLGRFPGARIFCARAGLAQVRRPGRFTRVRNGVLADLAPADIDARALFFEDLPQLPLGPELTPFESGADLLGDGSLLAVHLPGHCPGHWGLVVREADDRMRFLIADAAWSSGAVRDNAPPPRLTTALLGETGPWRDTLTALHRLWDRNPELLLTPSHCGEIAVETPRADG
ncbi:MBL fold metallo-hydrolase [Brevundimonas lenta]|uniref:Glyoxylase-like metal-dependent hydrolase (Beta-lactamase superfamily II) n=1 Tax=Brevundimonas lenta TaxID=424796 RepID=A0A7W6JE12_9CAUL|nr:MBL fold metallo-hydrolase [Brevundimonas lenta]MBB4082441.1 glyoxylase-like metal-dependent hydrolase (beta-lactamase superfamily II) [Brevundimonas lenta]